MRKVVEVVDGLWHKSNLAKRPANYRFLIRTDEIQIRTKASELGYWFLSDVIGPF